LPCTNILLFIHTNKSEVGMLQTFFTEERIHSGWRFWLLWVLATNIGFFAGLSVEWIVFSNITLFLAVPIAAIFQAWVLNRHIVILIPWVLVTALGWWVGVISILIALSISQLELTGILRVMVIAAWAGFIVGLLQWYILRGEVPQIGLWWVLVSAIGWAILLPGMMTGIPLAHYIEYDFRDLAYRAWQPSEEAKKKESTPQSEVA
jgi:hypothetical protein